MKKNTQVFKFGGASVKDIEGIKNVASIVKTYSKGPLVVVVSAMGKTTNRLEAVMAAMKNSKEEALEKLAFLKTECNQVIKDLLGDNSPVFDLINDHFVEAEWALDEPFEKENYDYLYDQVVSIGELVSTQIVAAYFNSIGINTQWVDARSLVRTDENYREGWVEWDETQQSISQIVSPLLAENKVVVTQGFIGSSSDNQTTTLGREGSDYTAAILSFCLDAERMSIWKDVPGVLTADPRAFDNASLLERLSYKEAIEMTYYGAKVIHPKTIKPLQNKSIPLNVRSFINPEGKGTLIFNESEESYPPMIAIEKGQALLQISTKDFSFVAEHHLSFLFQEIKNYKIQVNMMQNTAISFAVCVNDIDDRLANFAESINNEFNITITHGLELVTIRHYESNLVNRLKAGNMVYLESRTGRTLQFVMKRVPLLTRKTEV